MTRLARFTAIAAALTLSLTGAGSALAYPGQGSERGVFNATKQTTSKIAKALDLDPRCIRVRQAKAYAAWAWVGPTYRMGCDHQLDDALIMVKGNDKVWRDSGISGDNVYSCELLERNMMLYVEDQPQRIQKLTRQAYRDFKVAGYCEMP